MGLFQLNQWINKPWYAVELIKVKYFSWTNKTAQVKYFIYLNQHDILNEFHCQISFCPGFDQLIT